MNDHLEKRTLPLARTPLQDEIKRVTEETNQRLRNTKRIGKELERKQYPDAVAELERTSRGGK